MTRDPVDVIWRWYEDNCLDVIEGGHVLPFFCDPRIVGEFVVEPSLLAQHDSGALFRLLVCLSMYQGIRDSVVSSRQRSLSKCEIERVSDPLAIGRAVARVSCNALTTPSALADMCDVGVGGTPSCTRNPQARCPVKTASGILRRTSTIGKMPVSAYLHFGKSPGLTGVIAGCRAAAATPGARAQLLAAEVEAVSGVGGKLAAMFVGALSVRELYSTASLTDFDASRLLVVDTNFRFAVAQLTGVGKPSNRTCEEFVSGIAAKRRGLQRSPRMIQQALYRYCSRSNRLAASMFCSDPDWCVRQLCPFHRGDFQEKANADRWS